MDEINIKWIIKLMLALVFVYIISTAYGWISAISILVQDGVAVFPRIEQGSRSWSGLEYAFLGGWAVWSLFRFHDKRQDGFPVFYISIGIILFCFLRNSSMPKELIESSAILVFETITLVLYIIVLITAIIVRVYSYLADAFYFDYLIEGNEKLNTGILYMLVTLMFILNPGILVLGWFINLLNSIFT